MKQADPLLKMLRVGSSAVKLVETAMSLNNSQDPEQRSHTYSFMKTAIKELDDNFSNDGLKNHNNGSRVDDSWNVRHLENHLQFLDIGPNCKMIDKNHMGNPQNQWNPQQIALHINKVVKYTVQKAIHDLEKNNIAEMKGYINNLYKKNQLQDKKINEITHPLTIPVNDNSSRSPFVVSSFKELEPCQTKIKAFDNLTMQKNTTG